MTDSATAPAPLRGCIVIAAYDEVANIEALLRRIAATLPTIAASSWRLVLVVEGGDGTREVVERLRPELPPLDLLYQRRPRGLGAAFRRGFAAVPPESDVVVTLDADLNHQPEEIPRLLEPLRRGLADVVIGSRFVRGGSTEGSPRWKRIVSRVINRLMRRLHGIEVLDKTSGFRLYRAAALRGLRFANDDFAFLPELLMNAHRAGLRLWGEPIRFIYRVRGRSKMRFWATSASYLRLLRSRLGGS